MAKSSRRTALLKSKGIVILTIRTLLESGLTVRLGIGVLLESGLTIRLGIGVLLDSSLPLVLRLNGRGRLEGMGIWCAAIGCSCRFIIQKGLEVIQPGILLLSLLRTVEIRILIVIHETKTSLINCLKRIKQS